ncbi:MAG: hypothetical protein KJN97_04645, partial [Deltaproteobacteria bacterium]|nr:hypothetical protein [Deltaproteobacteria bacterium]
LHAAQAARPSEPAMIGIDSTELQSGRPGEASGVSRSSGSLAPDSKAESNQPVPPVVGGKRSRSGLGLLLLGLAAVILAIALWPDAASAPEPPSENMQPIAEPTPEPANIEAPPDAVLEDTVPAKEPSPEVPAVRPASLTVFVFPWGDVWIDGKRKGTAPVRNVSLKPGRYKISAGRGKPSKTKVIRLRDAQRKTVEFDLTK